MQCLCALSILFKYCHWYLYCADRTEFSVDFDLAKSHCSRRPSHLFDYLFRMRRISEQSILRIISFIVYIKMQYVEKQAEGLDDDIDLRALKNGFVSSLSLFVCVCVCVCVCVFYKLLSVWLTS
jgi:hypothetical protein